jgi:hypothetical protein
LFFTGFHILKVFDDILTTNVIEFAILYMLRNDHSREVKTKEREKNGWQRGNWCFNELREKKSTFKKKCVNINILE